MTVGARRFAAAAAAGLALSGCAGGAPTTPAAPAHRVAEPSLTAEGPAINWDTPFPGGIDVTPAEAQAVGGLAFTPVTPEFAARLVRTQVSDPAEGPQLTAVVYVYDFPVGPEFPVDGRVTVLEGPTDEPADSVRVLAAGHEGRSETARWDVVTLDGGDALVIRTATVGRVRFIRDGVYYDLTGPNLLPDTAITLARQLATTVAA